MAAGDVGRQVIYHSEHGDALAWVTEYAAGRDAGDHHVCGFTTAEQHAAGEGDVFRVWSVTGEEQGAFSFKT